MIWSWGKNEEIELNTAKEEKRARENGLTAEFSTEIIVHPAPGGVSGKFAIR